MLPCFHHQQSWIPTLFTLKCNAFAFGDTLEQSAGVCGDWDRSCLFSIPSSSHLLLEQALALQGTCCEQQGARPAALPPAGGTWLQFDLCAVSIPLSGPSPLLTHPLLCVCCVHAACSDETPACSVEGWLPLCASSRTQGQREVWGWLCSGWSKGHPCKCLLLKWLWWGQCGDGLAHPYGPGCWCHA